MTLPDSLAKEAAAFVRSLPGDQVEVMARALDHLGGPVFSPSHALTGLVPTPAFRAAAQRLETAWSGDPSVDSRALALALRAARTADEAARGEEQIEVVWTRPEGHVDVRLTYAVLVEVIQAAEYHLTLVSFAAYHVGEVVEALRRAAGAGVETRLVLDSGTGADRAFETLGDAVQLYTWPPTLLHPRYPDHASMHAKTAIADDRVAFVTSANLTGHALDRNMELGLLVRGGDVPWILAAHFGGLIAREVLSPVSRC